MSNPTSQQELSYCCGAKVNSRALSKIAEKNPMWKGDDVGYGALHGWVRRRLPHPKKCDQCKKRRKVDLANISQQYKRDISDWEWLCRTCHMAKDGRLDRLIEANHRRRFPDKKCVICKAVFHPKRLSTTCCSKSCAAKDRNWYRKKCRSSSGFYGVCFDKRYRKWMAYIFRNGKQTYIGLFGKKESAAMAYDRIAISINRPLESLNFPSKI